MFVQPSPGHFGWFIVFNATFNNISVIPWAGGQFYWGRKPKYPEKTMHRPVASH